MTGKPPEGTTMGGTFYFDPADRIYADHFPGRAVVPGSLIVDAFRQEADKRFALAGGRFRTAEFRFLAFVTPGERYPFRMEDEAGRLRCRLYRGKNVVATGFLQKER